MEGEAKVFLYFAPKLVVKKRNNNVMLELSQGSMSRVRGFGV